SSDINQLNYPIDLTQLVILIEFEDTKIPLKAKKNYEIAKKEAKKKYKVAEKEAKNKYNEKQKENANKYNKKQKEAENKYNEKLNETFRVACALDDYKTAFEFFQLIQNEGNNFTKSKVIYKIRIRLLGGFGCEQNIAKGQELIKEALRLGLTSTSAWVKQYESKHDFGASEVI
ncbi:28224_t:CDS:2, partial [Gigaspora margarita]